ncbi:MAG: nucleotidyltransferase family protein [Proteobacteria bacterium]|nr:nucleotidyltransferase family protein [Pseudomonadota bacterium]
MTVDGAGACFDLAAACCRWSAGQACDGAVAAAASAVTDWPRALRVLRRHRIEGLAEVALSAARVDLPPDAAAILRRRAQDIAHRNLAAAAESVRLQRLLDAAGIRSLHLKGMALAQLAYGSLAAKFSQDIDILVSPQNAAVAIELLQDQGYRLTRPASPLDERRRQLVLRYGREVALRHAFSGQRIELRWQLVNSPSLLAGVDASSPSQEVPLSGAARLRTLNDDDLFAYLCVHGAGHAWPRLQWLADLNAWMATQDDAALVRCYRLAEAKGAGTCAALAMLLCQRVLGRTPPPAIAPAIAQGRAAKWAVALALNMMNGGGNEVGEHERRFHSKRVALMQVLLGTNLRHYARVARDLSFNIDDMLAAPLPGPLHVVYPLVRLPLWAWRRLAVSPKRKSRSGIGSA